MPHPFGIIRPGGDHAAHGAKGAGGHVRLALPFAVFPAPAAGQQPTRHIGQIKTGGCHAQRPEPALGNFGFERLAAHIADDAAQQGIAQVAVFMDQARCAGEGHTTFQQRTELRFGQRCLAITPGIIGDETAHVVHQIGDGERVAPTGHFRHMRRHLVVQPQPAFAGQIKQRQRREGLGHAGNAKARVGFYRAGSIDIGDAGNATVHQAFAALDDPPRQARHLVGLGPFPHAAIDAGGKFGRKSRSRGGSGCRCGEQGAKRQWGEQRPHISFPSRIL